MRSLVGIGVLLVAIAPAAADGDLTTIEATGEAPADAQDARTRALDAAFVEAVTRALAAEADAAQLRRHREQVDARIIGRARRYIASFQTVDSQSSAGTLRIHIRARVDRGRLRAALTELGIGAGAPRPRGRPKLLVILRTELPGGQVQATFGPRGGDGDGGPAGAAFVRELGEQGFTTVAPAGPVTGRSGARPDELPVDDETASAAARAAGAGAVVVAGLHVTADGRIRGTGLHGARVDASVRLIDVDAGTAVTTTDIGEAGHGDDPRAAARAAAEAALLRAARSLGETAARRWPEARASTTAGIVVRVQGAASWASIEAIQAAAAPPGTRAVVRRVAAGEVDLAIEGPATTERVAGALGTAALPLGSLRVGRVTGDRVEVTVDGDAPGDD